MKTNFFKETINEAELSKFLEELKRKSKKNSFHKSSSFAMNIAMAMVSLEVC